MNDTARTFLLAFAAGVGLTLATKQLLISSSKRDKESVIRTLEDEFSVSGQRLNEIVRHFIGELNKGLATEGQTLKCIPSFVNQRPTGAETGTFLALDLGGTNFRVCEVVLEGKGSSRIRQRKFTVSDSIKTASEGHLLFDFLVDSIDLSLKEWGYETHKIEKLKLGFTFSFPCRQTALNSGYLMHWTKGFSAGGVEGKEVVKLLQTAFQRKKLDIHVTALVNDTVGTLVAHAYTFPETYVGVILGTGTNAAYVESASKIPKLPTAMTGGVSEMIVNIEWGAFDNEKVVLPVTKYDLMLDSMSIHPREQIFEKMTAGMYLGEITRLVLLDLIIKKALFSGKSSTELSTVNGFETAYMSRIERDHSFDLIDTKIILEDLLNVPRTTLEDRNLVKVVCQLVGTRSARLAACGVAAIVTKIGRIHGCVVAIDGSLFEHYPHFANRMRDALREVLGLMSQQIVLESARDGSGLGAAVIAALA